MKTIQKYLAFLMVCLLFASLGGLAQNSVASHKEKIKTPPRTEMKTYVIERNIPGAGKFSAEKLREISQTSNKVLKEMGPQIQWLHSYVTGDKIFCVYRAENMDLIREHAKRGGFPVTAIYEVTGIISPATGK